MNRVSQEWLVRPMGIFQLIDYVGVDVTASDPRRDEHRCSGEGLHSELIDALVRPKVLGGQNHDGSQKDGILKYEKGKPVGVYDLDKGGTCRSRSSRRRATSGSGRCPTARAAVEGAAARPRRRTRSWRHFAGR